MTTSALSPAGSTRAWRERRAWWATRLPQPCARCGQPVTTDTMWDLDHADLPRVLGGNDAGTRPAHSSCNRSAGASLGGILRGESGFFAAAPAGRDSPPLSVSRAEGPDLDWTGLDSTDPAWDACGWLDQLRSVPDGACWPRVMTGPHPAAVGTYGPELVEWAQRETGDRLRWWQQLVAYRLLEHDGEGGLVWLTLLLSTSRQVGKSWWLRALSLWRIHQADRFGEQQLVLHTGKDLAICSEVQRPGRAWARRRGEEGYRANYRKGEEEVSTPEESRWLVRSQTGVYGYSASVGLVDEAWRVAPSVVEDGVEPTMPERAQPQLLLVSTAHRRATALFPTRRLAALEQLLVPVDTLLMEWSAGAGADVADRVAWRAASPHWSAQRERLIASKLDRALAGRSDDPEEDDPVESFRSQYLNIWPARRLRAVAADVPLLEEGGWEASVDLSAALPGSGLVLAVEDWFGQGAAAAAAGRLDDGRFLLTGRVFARRADAFDWVGWLAERHSGCRLLVGGSLEHDPAAAGLPVRVSTAGLAQTRAGLPLLRELLAEGRLVHDGGPDLTGQVCSAWVRPSPSGGLGLSGRCGRTDLLRCAVWAVAEAVAPANVSVVTRPEVW